jgi:hypothetical protein
VGRNILIVESNNDKYFFQSVINHIKSDLEVAAPIFLDEDYKAIDGSDPKKLTNALKDLKADLQKEDIDRVGIILDLDRHSETERIELINKCIIKVFASAESLDRVSEFIDLNFDDRQIQLACYFTNVDGQGELETVLKTIKSQDSIHADCLVSWRECLRNKQKEMTDKKFDKLWITNYIRYDTSTKDDNKHANTQLTLNYALQNKSYIWNLDHPILDELKLFFRLFSSSPS